MKKRWTVIFLPMLLCAFLSGCLLQPAEDLYALPKQPAEYYTLQNQLDEILKAGGNYCAPLSGDRRQAVQLVDLDSDGQEEAVAFFKMPSEKPLKTYIFHKTESGYEQYACIEGDGSAFESVSYCQIDTALGLELVISRQVSDQVPQSVSVYSVTEAEPNELLNVSCVKYILADLDRNGLQELLAFRGEENAVPGVTDYYAWGFDSLEFKGSADMTAALTSDSIRRIVCGMMQKDIPAVFVANEYEPENYTIVTDVFILNGEEFCNVSLQGNNVNAANSIRFQRVYTEDIDEDGLIELPEPMKLPNLHEDSETTFYLIQWYNLHSDGTREYKKTTFHNYLDGWYIELDNDFAQNLVVDVMHDVQNSNGYGFYNRSDANSMPLKQFVIYTFTGNSAHEQAKSDGRFLLSEKGDVVYSCKIFDDALSQEKLSSAFHLIFTDWNSGEV